MHKGEFIDYIANQQNCTKVEAEKIINTFTNAVTSILAE
ncbi:MAG: HU family DNA-binding protein, partial [Candidatus Tisiphia sp.]